jgi:hypothetical protein
MAGVIISHKHVGTLNLRLPPTSVEWTYNMNTSTTDTYAGQVVQILSINFDRLTIVGRFGKEGAFGRELEDGKYEPRGVDELRDWRTTARYGVGLHQMHEWFQNYFAIASQGNEDDRYVQEPVTIVYSGRLDVDVDDGIEERWTVYPVSFPSFRRSNQDFAPEWRVECEIDEAPAIVENAQIQDEIERLRQGLGYTPSNRFSDPLGQYLPRDFGTSQFSAAQRAELLKRAKTQLQSSLDDKWQSYMDMLPAYTDQDLENLILMNGSLPAITVAKTTPGASIALPSGGRSTAF